MSLFRFLRSRCIQLPRSTKQGLTVLADSCVLFAAFHIAMWIRFELFFFNLHYFLLSIVAVASGTLAQALFGVYQYILRYMNERVIVSITASIVVSVMTVVSLATFLRLPNGLSRAVLLMYALLSLVALLGARFLARRLLFPDSGILRQGPRLPVIIYGAGSAGSQLAAALSNSPHYKPVAMLDDDSSKHRLLTAGVRIFPPSDLEKIVRRYDVRQLLIAMPTASRQRIREIVEQVEQYQLRVRLVPSFRQMVDQPHQLRLRDLQVEDLLGRDPVEPIPELLSKCVTGRNVLVTGAGGSIGSELCRQIVELRPNRLVLLEISEPALYSIDRELKLRAQGCVEIISVLGSVRDESRCMQCLRTYSIETIYHAAAYKHVPIVEQNIAEGLHTNVFGTRALADAAIKCGVQDFVLISSDKAVRPTNVMGASKRLAELILQSYAHAHHSTRFCMVRFGNVLNSSGSVVPLFREQILSGGPVTLTHPEVTRYFMTIQEAAQLVLHAGAMGDSGSVYLLDMGEPVRIRDLAEKMIRMYGLTVRDAAHPDGDIEIQVVGLRPGEKLYEELLIDANARPTKHPRIMRAKEYSLPYTAVQDGLCAMARSLASEDYEATLTILRSLIPEYSPKATDEFARPSAT